MAARVIVGISGGVDSSVAAALLVGQGYDVVGVTLDILPSSSRGKSEQRDDRCRSLGPVEDASRVAQMLGIPHFTLNYREVFEERVIKDFADEYGRGRTPNPCIRCNRYVKFEGLLRHMLGMNADYISTGHYARTGYDPVRQRYYLRKGEDAQKDQSYVLYSLSQDTLSHVLFPLGSLTKAQVRTQAAILQLPVASKAESQDICFVAHNDYETFLQGRYPQMERPGPFLDLAGRRVGEHRGIAFYTIGQRRGLGLKGSQPHYVVAIDAGSNTIVVGDEEGLYSVGLTAENMNWVSEDEPVGLRRATVKIRYRSAEIAATVAALPHEGAEVWFDLPQKSVTAGQAVVLYDGDRVIGGGTIARPKPTLPNWPKKLSGP